jgi:cobalt-zinc-cadmium efflux system membrane fusion protein
MVHRTDPALAVGVLFLAAWVIGCSSPPPEAATSAPGSWSVTAWGRLYEIFPEIDMLIAGEVASGHTHVTQLEGFLPMAEGSVEIVLIGAGGEQVFRADKPVRPGVFNIDILPASPGEQDLVFRINSAAGREEIRGGRVRVGTAQAPGGVIVAPVPKGASDIGEPLAFLKEEQWRSDFATAWVRRQIFAHSVAGLVRIRPPAGGETVVTSSVDAVLRSDVWPFPGKRVNAGDPLFRVVPRVAAESSLPALEAEVTVKEAELTTARARLARLEELLTLDATSQREVEGARTRVETLAAQHSAADRDFEAARSAREGGASASLTIRAPFSGEIASVDASPGATVTAGTSLARLVRTDLLWFEVALAPEGARKLAADGVVGVVLTFPEGPPIRLEEGLRLVSIAPEVNSTTGTVTVLLEAPPTEGLILGAMAEAQILLAATQEGVVMPSAALVDDGGVSVVYLQLSGESFARQQIHVLERQGERMLVDRLVAGQRLVTGGGEAIRRSSLMATGAGHGHVH